jgi:hypothetical protein
MKPVKTLNLEEALKLWSILGSHIPDDMKETPVQFIKGLITGIEPVKYLECVEILTGTPKEEITREDSIGCLDAFINGLTVNKIIGMKSLKNTGLFNG